MSELLNRLKIKFPHYKILSEPDPECGCKGAGERHVKPSKSWPTGHDVPCFCVCLSGDDRADCVKAFGEAVRKVSAEMKGGGT